MQRFLFPGISLGKNTILSDASFVHQISRVLRLSTEEDIVLFNGDGQEYIYTIGSITKKEVGLMYKTQYKNMWDTDLHIRLYQALPNKYEKIEYILQKGVEVWIREFIFFRSDRSQRLLIHERKIQRFLEIAREATEQCSGNRIPSIVFVTDTIPLPEDGTSYVFHTEDTQSIHLRDIRDMPVLINIFVGAEGGWSPAEISFFEKNNIQKIYLWSRILRTETTWPVTAFFLIQR